MRSAEPTEVPPNFMTMSMGSEESPAFQFIAFRPEVLCVGPDLLVFFGRGGGAIRHRDLDRPAGPLDAILEIFLDRLVFRALRAHRIGQAAVPFVAFVREDYPAVEWRQRQRHSERLGVRHWIVHRELI